MNIIHWAATLSPLQASAVAGRPSSYTRLEVSFVLALLAAGKTMEQVVQAYSLSRLTPEAIQEAIRLADQALLRSAKRRQLAVA